MSKNRAVAVVAILLVVLAMMGIAAHRRKINPVRTTTEIQAALGLPVRTARIETGNIEDTIPVTGEIKALDLMTLSSKMMGKVVAVAFREGDVVRKGQVVVQLDQTDALAALRQAMASKASAEAAQSAAQAGVEAAKARLSQARTSAAVTGVQSNAAVQQAKAGLAAAQANYEKVKNGARNQERMIAESGVATAKANLDNASANLRRYKKLFDQGAVADAQLEVAQTQFDVAQAQYNSAKQNLSLVQEGARNEDVRAAETQVAQAVEQLKSAEANQGQNALRQEDIKAALAGISQANAGVSQAQAAIQQTNAQVAVAQEQLNNTQIRSSIDGIVSMRGTEPGQTVLPGIKVMELVSLSTVFFEADVSETVLSKVRPGQSVAVTVDAYPDMTFNGIVLKLNPSASTTTRNFSVRIHVANPESLLRPGMFARGSIVTGGNGSALLIPQDAVEERDGKYVVFTIVNKGKDKTVRMHTVKRGLSNPVFVEILPPTDINAGDIVVTSGHESLSDKAKVYIAGGPK